MKSHRFTVFLIICSLSSILSGNIALAGSPMPLDKETVISCAIRMQKAIEAITPREEQMVTLDNKFAADLIRRMVVDPITSQGYDYDRSVLSIARMIQKKRLPDDPEYQYAINFIFVSVYSSSDHLLAYGYITSQTRAELDNVVKKGI